MKISTGLKGALKEAIGIAILSLAVAFLVNLFHPHKVAISLARPAIEYGDDDLAAQELPAIHVGADGDSTLVMPEDSIEPVVVSKSQVLQLIKEGRAVLLDARSKEEYQAGHIPGALHLPFEELGRYFDKVNSLPRDKWLITYCSGPPCDLGELLAFELVNIGFARVAVYQAGLDDWKKSQQVSTKEEAWNGF